MLKRDARRVGGARVGPAASGGSRASFCRRVGLPILLMSFGARRRSKKRVTETHILATIPLPVSSRWGDRGVDSGALRGLGRLVGLAVKWREADAALQHEVHVGPGRRITPPFFNGGSECVRESDAA